MYEATPLPTLTGDRVAPCRWCGLRLVVAATSWTRGGQEILIWVCPRCERGKLGRVEVRE